MCHNKRSRHKRNRRACHSQAQVQQNVRINKCQRIANIKRHTTANHPDDATAAEHANIPRKASNAYRANDEAAGRRPSTARTRPCPNSRRIPSESIRLAPPLRAISRDLTAGHRAVKSFEAARQGGAIRLGSDGTPTAPAVGVRRRTLASIIC
jgi:hypothetical protein